jgi:hypothetical protein
MSDNDSKQPPRSTDRIVAELAALMRQARVAQLAHDFAVALGAKCGCPSHDAEHRDNERTESES